MISVTDVVITINGANVSSAFDQYLQSISINLKAGGAADSCEITLNDAGGVLVFPEKDAEIEVQMTSRQFGGQTVFKGKVDEARSDGSRSSGMTLHISAKGVDTKGKAKEPKRKHWDKKSAKDVLTEAGKAAGFSDVKVSPALASKVRDYWAQQNESFLHFGERIAREIGGTFKIVGKTAILADRNEGKSASGQSLATVTASRFDNLISWSITPSAGRPRYKKVKSRYYDSKTAEWKDKEVEIENDDKAEATLTDRFTAADEGEAEDRAKSRKKESEREKGGGSITIDGNPILQPECPVIVAGTRPGADGDYKADSVVHSWQRGQGWTSRAELKKPGGSAGKDARA